MKSLDFELSSPAENEFFDIVDYYKQFSYSLSADFIQEFDKGVQRLKRLPESGSPYLHETRRVILNRFPYSIVYKTYHEVIVVHAVIHMKRKPGYWKKRLE